MSGHMAADVDRTGIPAICGHGFQYLIPAVVLPAKALRPDSKLIGSSEAFPFQVCISKNPDFSESTGRISAFFARRAALSKVR